MPYIGATARLYELELAREDAFGFFDRTTHRRVPLLEGYPEKFLDATDGKAAQAEGKALRKADRQARNKEKKNKGGSLNFV